ncbi:hypothetical protein [Methylobacterium frigidaeris]|uniref:hypothetical protein n=1 Tax=Methylobacterium frigidaeris TaxID=2038277 RepID=UPI001EDCC5B9|nr:hypothetical protein [Methylobacterium frigidaeris]
MTQKPFFLYLRSFRGDRETSEEWKIRHIDGSSKTLLSATPKAALKNLLQPVGPLVEIGGKSHLGLGRAKLSDEEWRSAALVYIIHATAIFINPDTTTSLAEELDFIMQGKVFTRRSFLVMEPTHASMAAAASWLDRAAAEDRQQRWNKIRFMFSSQNISLPLHSPLGAIISLYNTQHSLPFVGLSRYKLFDLLQKMYVDLNKLGSYDIDLAAVCPCNSGASFRNCHHVPVS